MEKKIPFEEAIKRLEEIVRTLEGGDVSLQDSLDLYEEASKLSKLCLTTLQEAQQKVMILQDEGIEPADGENAGTGENA